MSDENNMPKGRERPTGPCDCGRLEHGRHHADCPASGVFYSDKYIATPAAVGEQASKTSTPPRVYYNLKDDTFYSMDSGEPMGEAFYDEWMRFANDFPVSPPAVGEEENLIVSDREAEDIGIVLDSAAARENVKGDRADWAWRRLQNLLTDRATLLSAIRRLTAANAELARDRDAEKEHADRMVREVSVIARESMDRQITLAKLEAEVIASRDIVKAAESERDAAREEAKRLRGIVDNYARHHGSCEVWIGGKCDCGFDAALSTVEQKGV